MNDENVNLPSRFSVFSNTGKPSVVARFEDNDVWLTQKQLADLFNTTKQNVNQHTKSIYDSGELDKNRTVKKYLTVQNKLHYAVHEHTAAEVIYERVDNKKPNVGMMTFRGSYVTRDDVRIAKNYLTENELSRLNLLVSQFLDFAEYKALAEEPMSMSDWIKALDDQLKRLRVGILVGNGKVSHKTAMQKAEQEFEIYRQREMRQLKSDFDEAIKGYLGLEGKDKI